MVAGTAEGIAAAMAALTTMVACMWDRAVARVSGGILDQAVARVWGAADERASKYAVVALATAVVHAAGLRNACAAD